MAKHTNAYLEGFARGQTERAEIDCLVAEGNGHVAGPLTTDSAVNAGAAGFDGFTSARDVASYYRGYAAGLNAECV